jgi:large subunit ribosomal protein L10
VADLLNKYRNKNKKLEVRGSILGNSLLPADALKDVAKMPSRDEVLAQVAGGVQSPLASLVGLVNAPVADVAGLLNAVVSDIALVVQARADQLREQGDTAAPAA